MAGELFGDYSRMPRAGTGVRSLLAQQGRVVLDSDVNEQTSIMLRQLRALVGDLVGPFGGPRDALGFALSAEDDDGLVLHVHQGAASPGRYYVDGVAVEIDGDTTYDEQPSAFLDPELADDELPQAPFIAYLKAWERTITVVEDPDAREVALGAYGPDTTTRNQLVWQVLATGDLFGLADGLGALTPDDVLNRWKVWAAGRDANRATLLARAIRPAGVEDDPCPTPADSAYRGLENQLYRVEIHEVTLNVDGNITGATFKWSRDNGSATYPIELLEGQIATVTSLGRDRGLMLDVGDWVEVVDDRSVLYPGQGPFGRSAYPLLRVMDVEPLDRTVRLSAAPAGGIGTVPARHPFLRRWDQQPRPGGARLVAPGNALEVTFPTDADDVWIDLEDGVQVAFRPGTLRVGDYWLIPARTETGDVEWPGKPGQPLPLPPTGIDYLFAPLAIVRGIGDVEDLRMQFAPLSQPV